jgi:hypothetical protein
LVRRTEDRGKFDDLLMLLVKGLVFEFHGSTKPRSGGPSRKALPFLLNSQHLYQFGWHKSTYLALRPPQFGVLVVRSKGNKRLDSSELRLNNTERNDSIDIHWGGMGMRRPVNDWSEGCQVINSSLYLNPDNEVLDCRSLLCRCQQRRSSEQPQQQDPELDTCLANAVAEVAPCS